jgi:hypothetical protein
LGAVLTGLKQDVTALALHYFPAESQTQTHSLTVAPVGGVAGELLFPAFQG